MSTFSRKLVRLLRSFIIPMFVNPKISNSILLRTKFKLDSLSPIYKVPLTVKQLKH